MAFSTDIDTMAETDTQTTDQQIVVAVTRQIKMGSEKFYEDWVSRTVALASQYEGYMGANIIRPPSGSRQYTTIYRFNNHINAGRWQSSDAHAKAVAEVENVIEGETTRDVMTGLEVWFDPPSASHKPPTKWKMAMTLFTVVYVLINLLTLLVGPLLSDLPKPLQSFVIIAIQIVIMTYYLMPKVNQWLAKWLFK